MYTRYLIALFFIFCIFFNTKLAFTQITAGVEAGTNLSRVNDFSIDKQMLRPGLYMGIKGNYKVNKNWSFDLRIAWSEKSITYFNTEVYSSFTKLQPLISALYPELPDIKEILQTLEQLTGYKLNDSVYESNRGVVKFKTIEIPANIKYTYKRISITGGCYYSFLSDVENENTLLQEALIFEMLPPSIYEYIPILELFIKSTLPALNKPLKTTNNSTRQVATGEFGLTAGLDYNVDDYLSFGINYCHGITNSLHPKLPKDKTHSVIRIRITYNFFNRQIQRAKID